MDTFPVDEQYFSRSSRIVSLQFNGKGANTSKKETTFLYIMHVKREKLGAIRDL